MADVEKQYQDLYSMYEDATNSPYASYVPQPTRTAHDLLLGAIDDTYGQKLQNYIAQVKGLELQDKQYDRLFSALKRNGINPYYMFSSGGSMSGSTSFRPENSSPEGQTNSGGSAMSLLLTGTIGALVSALTRSGKAGRDVTKNVTNYFFGKK